MTGDEGRQRPPARTEQLRDAIDSGATGDKIPGGDPAAVPLGTDDEAAARSPTAAEVGAAHRWEVRRGTSAASPGVGSRRTGVVLIIGSMLCIAGGIAAAVFLI